MVGDGNKKNKMFYMIILVLTLITMTISATIAYFAFVDSQKKDETHLYTGTLEINYIDGVYIQNPDLFPLSQVTYNTKDKVYRNNFSVKSTGSLDQKLTIDLNITKNEFPLYELKYVIYNENGDELSSGYVPKTGKVTLANNLFLASNDLAKYILILWLDDKNYNQNVSMGKSVSGNIYVTATQIKY